jgi:hypothetical protein
VELRSIEVAAMMEIDWISERRNPTQFEGELYGAAKRRHRSSLSRPFTPSLFGSRFNPFDKSIFLSRDEVYFCLTQSRQDPAIALRIS